MNTEETFNLEEDISVNTQNFNDAPQSENLRDELLHLSAAKKIKHSEKYLKKASQGALEKIKLDYQRDQLEKVNSLLTENLITKFSELMEQLNMVEKDGSLDKDLSSNTHLYDDVKLMVTKISPYIPMIGLLSGGLTVAKHMWDSGKPSGADLGSFNKENEVQNDKNSGTTDSGGCTSDTNNS